MDYLRILMATLGTGLVITGAMLLFYMATMIYHVLNTPEQVGLVQYIMTHIKAEDLAIYGSMKDQAGLQNIKIELNMSQSIRTILFMGFGAAIFGILSAVAARLVSGGVKMIELAARTRRRKPQESANLKN